MKDFVTIYMPIILFLMASWLFYVGGIVIVKKRPYVLKARHLMTFMLLCFAPALIAYLLQLKERLSSIGPQAYIFLIVPFLYVVVLMFFRLVMKGYVLFGVTADSFRDPLLRTLKKLGLGYEETIYGIILKPDDTLIQSNIQTQVGTAQLFCKKGDRASLEPIVDGLKEYYRSNDVEVKYTCSVFYCIMASIILCMGALLSIVGQSLPS